MYEYYMNEQINKGRSLIHEIDPRMKIYFAIIYSILCIMSTKLIPLIVCGVVVTAAVVLSGISIIRFFRSSTVLIIFALLFVTGVIFALFSHYKMGLSIFFSGVFIILMFETVTFSTRPEDLLSGFHQGFRLPAPAAIKMLIFWEFLPIYAYERERVYKAMAIRGMELFVGSISDRLTAFPTVAASSLRGAVMKAKNIENAIKLKCFDPNTERIVTHPIKYGRLDYSICIVTIVMLFLIILTQYFLS